MTTIQKTLYAELNEVSKEPYQVARPLVLNQNDFVSSGKGIVFPCPIARRLPIDERPGHMSTCDACKRIEKEFDEHVGVVGCGVWYDD